MSIHVPCPTAALPGMIFPPSRHLVTPKTGDVAIHSAFDDVAEGVRWAILLPSSEVQRKSSRSLSETIRGLLSRRLLEDHIWSGNGQNKFSWLWWGPQISQLSFQ